MNIVSQLATQLLINKNLLVQLLQTLNFSTDFVREFRHNHIHIGEERIRRKMRLLCDITHDQTFKDLCCHDNGVQFVFYTAPRDSRLIRFRISFDVKILEVVLNHHQQSMQILISGIRIQSLNHFSKPFRFCIQSKARTLVTDELERLCAEHSIPYDRLFRDIRDPLAYRINLSKMKELDQLRQRHFIIGNRSLLDVIQITAVDHREQAIVLSYRLHDTSPRPTTLPAPNRLSL